MNVEVHKRHYLPDEPDPAWIEHCTLEKKWVIISGDKGIEFDGINRHAVVKAKAKVFLLTDTNSRGAEWAASLVMARHKMLRIAAENNGPFYCTIAKGNDQHIGAPRFLEDGGPIASLEKGGTLVIAATSGSTPSAESPPLNQPVQGSLDLYKSK